MSKNKPNKKTKRLVIVFTLVFGTIIGSMSTPSVMAFTFGSEGVVTRWIKVGNIVKLRNNTNNVSIGANNALFVDTTGGNIGINTNTPGSKLNIVGSTNDSSASSLSVFNASSTSLFFIRNDGNVGIGTTNPNVALNVLNTNTQMKLAYDSANYSNFYTGDTGNLSLNLMGSAPGYTVNLPFASQNAIPIMTSNTTPLGTASASGTYGSPFLPWNALDGNTATAWSTGGGVTTGWLAYQFTVAQTIFKYTILKTSGTGGGLASAPKNWTFEGWNGSTWVVLDTQINQTKWGASKNTYNISNASSYTAYRINISANNGGTYVQIDEMEMLPDILIQNVFKINNVGNMGIGINNSSPSATLHVYNATFSTGITRNLIQEGSGQSTNEVFGVYANNGTTPRLVVQNGNVGIGTTTPNYPLTISGSGNLGQLYATTNSNSQSISVGTLLAPNSPSGPAQSDIYFSIGKSLTVGNASLLGYSKTGNSIGYAFLTTYGRPASDFAITTAGNIGIGTTTPLKALDIFGSARITGKIITTLTGTGSSTTGSNTLTGSGTSFTTDFVVGDGVIFNGDVRTVMAIASDTSLTVDMGFSGTVSGLSVYRRPSIFTLRNNSNVEKLVVSNTGLIGMGAVNPTTVLDVRGPNLPLGTPFYGAAKAQLFVGTTDALGADIGGSIALGGLYDSTSAYPMAFATIHGKKETAGSGSEGGYLSFEVSNNATSPYNFERMRINSLGNVGIGASTPNDRLEVNGGIRLNTTTVKPTCDTTHRGTLWMTQGGAGVKDTLEVCAKDAADAYNWRTIY